MLEGLVESALMGRLRSERARIVVFNLVAVAVLLLGAEAIIDSALRWPGLIPGFLLQAVRNVYWSGRDLIQFTPACAQYDSRLTYTLRPGSCTFEGPEFSNAYAINSLGLRDDEASLTRPAIIVLGDSEAMGWGVDQEDTFAQVLERRTGLKVLNAAVSSYATARELVNLTRLDRSALQAIVIQYCANDIGENNAFAVNGNQLYLLSEEEYDANVRGQRPLGFGRGLPIVFGIMRETVKYWFQGLPEGESDSRELDSTELFLNVLRFYEPLLQGVPVLVFEITNNGDVSPLVPALRAKLVSNPSALGTLRLQVLDATTVLRSEHYYRLDGHLNKAGHQVVAEAIIGDLRLADRGGAPQLR